MPTFRTDDGVDLAYEVLGDSRAPYTVVFLNGVMATMVGWYEHATLFERHGARVVLHDLRGQLRSGKPPGPYTFERHALDLWGLLDHLEVGAPVHLVGTSYGGEVAMRAAIDAPARTRSLVVVDSVSEVDPLLASSVRAWRTMAESAPPEEFVRGAASLIYGPAYFARHRETLAQQARAMAQLPRDFFQGQVALYDTFLTLDLTRLLGRISCPTLVVCGEDDLLKPRRFSRLIAEGIRGAEYVLIPECGHATFIEKPAVLGTLLLGFVLKHAVSGTDRLSS